MPVYVYRCAACEHTFDVLHAMLAKGPETCPKCGAKEPQRVPTAPAVHFKGSGFYTTDYKKSDEKTNTDDTKEEKHKE